MPPDEPEEEPLVSAQTQIKARIHSQVFTAVVVNPAEPVLPRSPVLTRGRVESRVRQQRV